MGFLRTTDYEDDVEDNKWHPNLSPHWPLSGDVVAADADFSKFSSAALHRLMAFRGRGRGRGGGGGFRFATQEVFELFPKLDEPPDTRGVKEEVALVRWSYRLQSFWNSSPYYLKDVGPEKDESIELMRGFDTGKQKTEQKVELADFMKCSVEYIPAELADRKPGQVRRRKVRWSQESDLHKLDLFEKQEQKSQGQDENGVKGKKEDENEEEDDEKIEDEEEEISDGDYNQNECFDDDEDDFNMEDDNDDEGTY
ncbi:hypothetical protein RHMOL_Rhmol13G0234100 [Rhododendron molle]|uniref:Uncharacterized protein n=1 Tax=Rhododendron molle TaxID=49168 RepID=A0ACC0L9V0_RHOML|nr:hypothetical protein RHMOL_Rhmol13G0234100 [Rhododendron molle]